EVRDAVQALRIGICNAKKILCKEGAINVGMVIKDVLRQKKVKTGKIFSFGGLQTRCSWLKKR
ncbi:hypothetical protein HAX54_029171, partial [Datura stramonium]|nr:hypothetical protein [Datura stramonium]